MLKISNFQFTEEQTTLLESIKKHVKDTRVVERLRTDRTEHIDKFTEVLEEVNFPEDDLSENQIDKLFWHMRRVMHNRALGSNLYSSIGIQSFNNGLRILFDESISLVRRIDSFLTLGGIGRVTTSHFLFMRNPEKYPLTTMATREVLGLDESQLTDAVDDASQIYNIATNNPQHERTIKILGDIVIFSKAKEILEVNDFYAVNLLLWDESRERTIPESNEDLEEYQDSLMLASRESDLQEYLANHPNLIEEGLELIEKEKPVGSAGRIDLLMRDSTGRNVVVETKKGRSNDSVVGQTSRYMGWVSQNMDGPVRGIIVVADPDDRLLLAVAAHPTLSVKYYRKFYRLSDNPFNDNS